MVCPYDKRLCLLSLVYFLLTFLDFFLGGWLMFVLGIVLDGLQTFLAPDASSNQPTYTWVRDAKEGHWVRGRITPSLERGHVKAVSSSKNGSSERFMYLESILQLHNRTNLSWPWR